MTNSAISRIAHAARAVMRYSADKTGPGNRDLTYKLQYWVRRDNLSFWLRRPDLPVQHGRKIIIFQYRNIIHF
jgi:hypothetical protein